jgi:hypothetical protein
LFYNQKIGKKAKSAKNGIKNAFLHYKPAKCKKAFLEVIPFLEEIGK